MKLNRYVTIHLGSRFAPLGAQSACVDQRQGCGNSPCFKEVLLAKLGRAAIEHLVRVAKNSEFLWSYSLALDTVGVQRPESREMVLARNSTVLQGKVANCDRRGKP